MIEEIKNWAGLMALLISLGTTVYAWLTSKSRVNAEHLKAVDDRLNDVRSELAKHDRRIQSVEHEIRHLPDKDTVMELKLSISELKGVVGRLDESHASVARTVQRIDGYLRKQEAN